MEDIDEAHVSEPGLVVLDITGADDHTVIAVMTALAKLWATSGVSLHWQVPGRPGVCARLYADILRPGTSR